MENKFDTAEINLDENENKPEQTTDSNNPFGFEYADGINYGDGFSYDLSQYGASPYGYDEADYYPQTEPAMPIRSSEELLEFFEERASNRRYANPVFVLALMLFFFPAGLAVMYFHTKWGVFAKIMITLFVFAAVLALYEIIVAKQIVELPSVIQYVGDLYSQYFG